MIAYVGERHIAGAAMGDLLADAFLLFAAPVGRSGRRRDPGHTRRAGHALRRRACPADAHPGADRRALPVHRLRRGCTMARPQEEIAVLRRFVALQLAAPPAPLLRASGDVGTIVALALCWTTRPAAIWPTSAVPTCPGCSSISPAAPRGRAPCCMDARGRIEWPATIKGAPQRRVRPDPLRLPRLRHQLTRPRTNSGQRSDLLDATHAAVPAWLRDGTLVVGSAAGEDAGDGPADATPSTQRRLAALRASMARARRNVYLRQVTPPPLVTDEQRRRLRQADMPEYGRALALYTHRGRPSASARRCRCARLCRRRLPAHAAAAGCVDAADDWLQALVELLA
ncbi:MAG: hypothetical protein R2851_24100 [Caldilineaceae bacterium]